MLEPSQMRINSLSGLQKKAGDSPGTDFAVLPDAAKLVFRGRAAAVAAASGAFGVELPRTACRFAKAGNRAAYWLGPDEWMLHATGEDPAPIASQLEASLSQVSHSIVDISHRSDAFSISGAHCEFILNHGCPLDLSIEAFPVGMCTRTILENASILLSRPAPQIFHVDVWRSFAPYVWEFLAEACRGLAQAPISNLKDR